MERRRDSHRLAVKKYNKRNLKTYTLQLNKKTDKDIIEFLETVPNKNGYFKQLIRDNM